MSCFKMIASILEKSVSMEHYSYECHIKENTYEQLESKKGRRKVTPKVGSKEEKICFHKTLTQGA